MIEPDSYWQGRLLETGIAVVCAAVFIVGSWIRKRLRR